MPAPLQSDETLYLSEQRRFRRLEVSLPVWLAVEEDFNKPGAQPWSLGYTRDISMGGSKVFVPVNEEAKWRAVNRAGGRCLLKFDAPDIGTEEYITGLVKHTAHDKESGNLWLGVEYEPGADEAKAATVKTGLATMKARRRWQGLTALAVAVIVVGGILVGQLQAQSHAQQEKIAQLRKQQDDLNHQLTLFSQPRLVGTRAEGINASFQRKEIQQKLLALRADASSNSRDNGEKEEAAAAANQQALSGSQGATINLGVALPYGYAWPQVTSDVEQMIGRHVPTVVVFRDFKSPFPLADCRQARVLAKTLQITWEPHYFEDPKKVKLQDIIAGKWDSYIDAWAAGAKSFGSEVWIRWGHEFNGNWYPWCVANNNQDPQIYAKAFRHVRDRFNRAGAFNARWVWCINAETVPNVAWNNPMLAYPGDAYVDMISVDGYNFGNALASSHWESFDEVFATRYKQIVQNHANKPLMINEIGCATTGGDKAAWIREMDRSLRSRYPKIEGVVWFEAQKEADWRMASSPESLEACSTVFKQTYYRRGEP